MKRYVVKLAKNVYLGGSVYHSTRDINRAVIFNSKKEAKEAWSKYKKDLKNAWHYNYKDMSIKELPSKGLKLEQGEVEFFGGAECLFDNEYNGWERYALKELNPSDALRKLADFKPDPENYKTHLRLYFWDDESNDRHRTTGGFLEGEFSSLYGYDHESRKFITENLVGAYYHKDHAASYRIIDSGSYLPIYIDNELAWCNVSFFIDWIKYDGHTLDEIKPAFETSIDFDKFMERVKAGLKRYEGL